MRKVVDNTEASNQETNAYFLHIEITNPETGAVTALKTKYAIGLESDHPLVPAMDKRFENAEVAESNRYDLQNVKVYARKNTSTANKASLAEAAAVI